jgi:tetratricopeptide (TPR) repeat protein
MRARTIVGVILAIAYGSSFAAASADHCPPEPKCTAADASGVAPGCGCSSGEKPSGNAPSESKIPAETEALLQVSEHTLRDVEKNTDFLATLWKWTTIASSIVAAVIAIFGIRTFSDLSSAKDKALEVAEQSEQAVKQANQAVTTMEQKFKDLSKEITANFFVMMGCMSVQSLLDAIASEHAAPSTAERPAAASQERKTEAYRGVVNQILPLLQKHDPKDRATAAYAYDILGFAQFKTGDASAALKSARKSIEFAPENATALYNAASYAAKLHLVDVSVGFLEHAIERDQKYLASARSDPDFDSIRGSPQFARLVGA